MQHVEMCLLLTVLDLFAFAVDPVMFRTVAQPLTCLQPFILFFKLNV